MIASISFLLICLVVKFYYSLYVDDGNILFSSYNISRWNQWRKIYRSYTYLFKDSLNIDIRIGNIFLASQVLTHRYPRTKIKSKTELLCIRDAIRLINITTNQIYRETIIQQFHIYDSRKSTIHNFQQNQSNFNTNPLVDKSKLVRNWILPRISESSAFLPGRISKQTILSEKARVPPWSHMLDPR